MSISRINKILIANRGEIACRVIRTAKRLGIQTVSVFSDADRDSLHVKLANEAYHIGPPPSSQSYLCADKIIEVAKRTGAQAVHPGYGFLSENTEFAEQCASNNIIFIGPPASAIRDMGIKNTSKDIMERANVPVIRGYHGNNQDPGFLRKEAVKIGFPVMIKAIRGGGGKGMRIAETEADFQAQLDSAKREALKSFGNDDVLLENYVSHPRHVEVQVFGDQHGNYLYFYERDCSVQRRHQKIIEEAPAPLISWETRRKIGEAACRAAAAVNYVGAGTVEFILDSESNFFFMEMNTRLQVEHPVTEMITNLDLVELQIRIAEGNPLKLKQDDVPLKGHAFEARIYAEDTTKGFLPTAGKIVHMSTPSTADDVRIDSGVLDGDEIGVFYDPLVAKLIVWGSDRETALQKLCHALRDYQICGLQTNRDFLLSLASNAHFKNASVHTGFIAQHEKELFPKNDLSSKDVCFSALALVLLRGLNAPSSLSNFRVNSHHTETVVLKPKEDSENVSSVQVVFLGNAAYRLSHQEGNFEVTASVSHDAHQGRYEVSLEHDSHLYRFHAYLDQVSRLLHVFLYECHHQISIPEPRWRSAESQGSSLTQGARAPMPGVVEKILVSPGQEVKSGDSLVTLLAMKMEYIIKSPKDGVISELLCKEGQTVPKNCELVKFKTDDS